MNLRSSRNPLFRGNWRGLLPQFVAVILLPLSFLLIVFAIGSDQVHQAAMREMVAERDENAVRTAAQALQAEIQHRASAVQGLAAWLPASGPQELDQQLAASEFLLPDFDHGLAFFSPAGDLLASRGDPAFWQAVAAGEGFDPDRLLASAPGAQAWLLPESAPEDPPVLVVASRSPQGVVAAGAVSPAGLVEETLSDAFPPAGMAAVMLVGPQGQLLYQSGELHPGEDPLNPDSDPLGSDSDPLGLDSGHTAGEHTGIQQALAGTAGTTYLKVGREEHVVAFSPVEPLGWGLVVEESWAMVSTPNLRSSQAGVLVLMPLLFIALVSLWFGTRQVIQPLQALEGQAASVSWGNYDAIEKPVGGIAEIRHLQAELVHLTRKIRAAQQSLHDYIGAITAGQEEERRRLARELHDDTIQTLIALKQRVQLAHLALQDRPETAAMAELETMSEQAIENLRRLTRALRPIYLEDLGLAPALKMLAAETGRTAGLEVEFQQEGREVRLEPAAELALYRMVQEALSNIARHAQAHQASVRIAFRPSDVTVEVSDDGQGFEVPKSPAEFAPSGHFGLLGLHERAELIGARLEIQSAPQQGTRLIIRLPV